MSLQRCMDAMSQALGRRLTYEEAEAFAERLEATRQALGARGLPSDILSAARAVRDQEDVLRALAQRNVLIARRVYRQIEDRRLEMGVDDATFLQAFKVGVNSPMPGGRLSIDAQHLEIFSSTLGGLIHDLRRAGGNGADLVDWALHRDHEIDIVRALRGERAELPPEAVAVAEAIDRHREALRARENRAGGWRGRLDGYVGRQHHDPELVQRAGLDAWRAEMRDLLDPATFERDAEMIARLQAERWQVGGQLNEARTALAAHLAEYRTARPLANKAEARQATADARETRLEGQVAEARKETADALQRYMELAQRERDALGGDPAAPIGVEDPVAARRAGAARAEARVALTRARERLNTLHDQLSGARHAAAGEAAIAARLRERVDAELSAHARAEAAVDLFVRLGDELRELEGRLRRPIADPDAYLADVFNRITTNLWLNHERPQFDGVHDFVGPANLAAKRAAHRELIFRDAEAELTYARRYGRGNVMENVVGEFEHAARAIALMENLGPNPRAMHDRLVLEAKLRAAEAGDVPAARELSKRYHENQLAEIMGETRSASAGPTLAMWSSATRALLNMAKLGGAAVSSLGDLATNAAALTRAGVNPLKAHADVLRGVLRGRRSGEARAIADLIGVGLEGMTGRLVGRFNATDNVAGRLANVQQLFFRLNLLNWWTDTQKTTAGLVTAAHFGSLTDRGFTRLADAERRMLTKYGIDAERWEVVRRAAVERDESGRAFLTAHGVRNASLGEFVSLFAEQGPPTERMLVEARDRLATAYGALIRERAEFAVPTPGAAERALMNQGTPRGTPLGEALRFVMQFKGFGVSMIHKALGESLYGEAGRITMGSIAKTGFLIGELTVLGYLAMAVKDLAKGREPRDPFARETVLAALLQGGGGGIYGDFLFGEYNRFGRSAAVTMAGPLAGSVSDIVGLSAKLMRYAAERGAPKDEALGADALRVLVGHTPFANLFYTRLALDWFVLWPLSERINPGWARKFERRIERENGQEFWARPTEAVR